MTDVATKPDAEGASDPSSSAVATTTQEPSAPETTAQAPTVQWAPAEPAAKKTRKRLWLWIGVPVALIVAGVVTASLVLIAPGTSVAGVPVGLQTAGAATDAIGQRLAQTTLTLGDGGPTVTGADLGATVDAQALADSAFGDRPMWNLTQWFGEPIDAPITLDEEKATAALREALPSAYTEPTAATVAFNGTSFVVTPAVAGTGIDLDSITRQLHDAFASGAQASTVTVDETSVEPVADTAAAQKAADGANAMLANVGFYVGDERTVPVDAATAAGWLTVTSDASGAFTVTADPAKIQPSIDALAAAVNRPPVNGAVITDAEGTVLETTTPGADGRTLGDVSTAASDFAKQLGQGNGVYELPVQVTPPAMATSARMIEVDLGDQMLYMKENGAVVDSWPISSGIAESPTTTGHFTVQSHHDVQTMTSSSATDDYWNYEVPNVQWIMYYYGGEALHGVYWHNDFGNPRSHGCVGMPNYRAKQIYDWMPNGGDVWIHE